MVKTEAFDDYAIEYDKWFDNHEREYAQELKAVKALLPEDGEGVEIGAGTGRFTRPLGISLGVEPSESMRKLALERDVNIISGTAESLPIQDAVYDFALLVTTVCFLDAPELAFKEVYRILKAEGVIIVGLIDRDSILGKKYEQKKNKSKFYKDANFHSVGEIREDLEQAGFNSIEYVQAIMPGDVDEPCEQVVRQGYGEGSFVVMRARKRAEA